MHAQGGCCAEKQYRGAGTFPICTTQVHQTHAGFSMQDSFFRTGIPVSWCQHYCRYTPPLLFNISPCTPQSTIQEQHRGRILLRTRGCRFMQRAEAQRFTAVAADTGLSHASVQRIVHQIHVLQRQQKIPTLLKLSWRASHKGPRVALHCIRNPSHLPIPQSIAPLSLLCKGMCLGRRPATAGSRTGRQDAWLGILAESGRPRALRLS